MVIHEDYDWGIDEMLSVAYGNAALDIIVEMSKKFVDQENRIAKLESLINNLTQQ